VLDWPSGKTAATIDGYEEPVWLGTGGELLVRTTDDRRMFVLGADLRTLTRLGNLVSSSKTGAYNATADGRYIVYSNAVSETSIIAYDRTSGASWVAATDRISSLTSPVVSPDGRFMAVFSRVALATVPHVIPFGVNTTVAVDDPYALKNTIAECGNRMGWCA
jgi:Tol biopolymer transport system component